jgi:hypothetical protein
MIESYWPVWVIIGIIFFIEGYRLNRLQDRVDTLEIMLKNRVDVEMYLELLSEVKMLRKEIRKDGAV